MSPKLVQLMGASTRVGETAFLVLCLPSRRDVVAEPEPPIVTKKTKEKQVSCGETLRKYSSCQGKCPGDH